MRFTRSSGILLHITSLPSKFGIGDFGPKAYEFVNFHKRLNSGKIGFGSVWKTTFRTIIQQKLGELNELYGRY